jgi:hypothetical protein
MPSLRWETDRERSVYGDVGTPFRLTALRIEVTIEVVVNICRPSEGRQGDIVYDVNRTLGSLIENVEDDDGEWGIVYLDNARLSGQSGTEFRAHLSALAKRGVYKPIDNYAFGKVLIDAA